MHRLTNLNKNFIFLLIGQFISVIGDRISSVVFLTIAAEIINNISTSYQSSLLLGIQVIPLFLFGYFFGLFADNFKKKNLMIIADIGRIIIILILYFFHTSLIFLYISIFLLGTFTAMFEPSRKAILPFIIRKKDLIFLNKVYATMEIFAMVIGLGIGAFLLEIISIDDALLLDMSTYIISFILILFIKYHDNNEKIPIKKEIIKTKKKIMMFFSELKAGIKYLKSEPNSFYIITNLVFFHFFAAGLSFTAITDFGIRTSKILNLNPGSNISFALFLVAVGAMFSPIVKNFFGKLKESKITIIVFYIGAISLFSSTIFTFLFPQNIRGLYFIFFLMGIIAGLQYIRFLYLIHIHTEKKYMGRVVSIAEITISLTVVLGVLFGSYVNEIYTYKYGLLLTGLIYFFGGISFRFIKDKITW